MCVRGRVGQGPVAAVRRRAGLPQGRLPIMCFATRNGQVLRSHMLLVSHSADIHIPPEDANPYRVRSMSRLLLFHMLQLEIVEVGDGIGFRP
jgi:hypothetical protein